MKLQIELGLNEILAFKNVFPDSVYGGYDFDDNLTVVYIDVSYWKEYIDSIYDKETLTAIVKKDVCEAKEWLEKIETNIKDPLEYLIQVEKCLTLSEVLLDMGFKEIEYRFNNDEEICTYNKTLHL